MPDKSEGFVQLIEKVELFVQGLGLAPLAIRFAGVAGAVASIVTVQVEVQADQLEPLPARTCQYRRASGKLPGGVYWDALKLLIL